MRLIRKIQILWILISILTLYSELATIYYYNPIQGDEGQPYIEALLLISNLPLSIVSKLFSSYIFDFIESIFKVNLHYKGYRLGYFFTFIDWLIITLSGALQWFIVISKICRKITAMLKK